MTPAAIEGSRWQIFTAARRIFGERRVRLENVKVRETAPHCASIRLLHPPVDIYGRGRSAKAAVNALLGVFEAIDREVDQHVNGVIDNLEHNIRTAAETEHLIRNLRAEYGVGGVR